MTKYRMQPHALRFGRRPKFILRLSDSSRSTFSEISEFCIDSMLSASRLLGTVAALLVLPLLAAAAGPAVCPERCSCLAESATLVCSGWPLSEPLPLDGAAFSRLVLRNVSGAVPDAFFANASRLRALEIRGAAGLRLDGRSLAGLHGLRRLAVTGADLTELAPLVLALLPRLETLDLAGGRLARLHRHQFTYNTHLARLNLSGNPLAGGVHEQAFAGAERLRWLGLRDCGLRRAPAAWFVHLPALETLDLSANRLSSVRAADTRGWAALRSLNLSANDIGHVEPGAFNATANLTSLDLSRNYLSRLLGTGLTAGRLDLSSNSFTVANRSYLELPERLRQLRLSDCARLTRVGRNLLQRCALLERVVISRNGQLAEIEHTAFSHLARLRHVDLSHNALRKLPRSLEPLPLQSLALAGNRFVCDCSLRWYARRPPAENLTCQLGDSSVPLAEGVAHVLCTPVSVTVHQTQAWADFNGSAVLECRAGGRPTPSLTWITPRRYVFHWSPAGAAGGGRHPARHTAALGGHRELDHYTVLEGGRLRVERAAARHQGRYVCLAESDAGAAAASVFLTVGVSSLHDIKMMALLMALTGCLTAIAFALVVRLSLYIFYKCGCCICCTDELPPRAKRLKAMMDSMEQWRALQLASLRENYNQQVAGIKDSCYQQVERIRDTYKGQARYLGDMRDYGAQQIEGFRDQYLDQVRRVRDYSLGQMNRVHENYIFQRNRIRKFSAHQRVRLRETCKYQQKTFNKILENLPDLYLQNCRTGTCQRTESMVLPGEQFRCDADVQWSAEELAQLDDICARDGDSEPDPESEPEPEPGPGPGPGPEPEPAGPELAGAELTRRLLTLAPALELALEQERQRQQEQDRQQGQEQEQEQSEEASRRPEPAAPLAIRLEPAPAEAAEAAADACQVQVLVLETDGDAAEPPPQAESAC